MNNVGQPIFLDSGFDGLTILKSFFSKQSRRVFALVDSNTRIHCLPLLEDVIPFFQVIEIPAGEKHKTLNTCDVVWDDLLFKGMTRKDILVGLGGGCLTDITGFCASVYKRGVPFLFIPTTLLGMTDAALGGKNGVDMHGYKNMLGTLNQPEAVFIWNDFLKTLDDRDLKSGYVETLKHSLIADAKLWTDLPVKLSVAQIPDFVKRSVAIKMAIVKSDPFEASERKLLNFGHTCGHAIETWHLKKGNLVLHGEAIAVGMCIEGLLSVIHGLSMSNADQIIHKIKSVFGGKLPNVPPVEELLPFMHADKKNIPGEMNFSLLSDIGKGIYNIPVSKEQISKAIAAYSIFD